jgi:antitoxin Phd
VDTWQIQQAKSQTSGPQFITHHGKRRAVLLSADSFARLSGEQQSFTEHLLNFPKIDGLDELLERDPTTHPGFEFDEE